MKKVAVITGGTRGIGLGIAHALATKGWSLALNGMRQEGDVLPIIEELKAYSNEVIYAQGNVGDDDERARMVRQIVEHFGTVHALINNAGVAPSVRADLLETTPESYDRVMGINLRGPFFLSQSLANHMIEVKAQNPDSFFTIVNVSSISATVASINRGEYCLSKAGMSMMTKLFAIRLGEHDIPVYEVRPGVILTDMTGPVKAKYDKLIEAGLSVQKRWGYPEDVGKSVASLLDGDLPFSTGQVIMIDGGLTIERL
ncbi:MAG: 3-ketoacyl-ACP reductase [Saprospiraceae bacterium]|nr:3-ketoacyl-ACP reductase [Saprospiraceae bacterium]